MADYIPQSDGGLRAWAQNFSAVVSANPSTLGLMPSDAQAIAAVVNAFISALALATDPSTRTRPTVAAKDSAKAAMLHVLRRYAQAIKQEGGVTNEEKIALGLSLSATSRSAVPAPGTQPICSIIGTTPCQHTLRFADASTPAKRAKPPGAIGLELHYFVGKSANNPPKAPEEGNGVHFYGVITRQPCSVKLNPTHVGKQTTYYARWITRTGQTGPWSSPVSMTVAG